LTGGKGGDWGETLEGKREKTKQSYSFKSWEGTSLSKKKGHQNVVREGKYNQGKGFQLEGGVCQNPSKRNTERIGKKGGEENEA